MKYISKAAGLPEAFLSAFDRAIQVIDTPNRQGLPPLISFQDMEVRSQKSGVRMAAAYAFSMRLTSSRMLLRAAVSP